MVWGMPGALAKAGGAEFIVTLDRIAGRLIQIMGNRSHREDLFPDLADSALQHFQAPPLVQSLVGSAPSRPIWELT